MPTSWCDERIDNLKAALGNAYDVMCVIYALEPLSDEGKKVLKEAGDLARTELEK